MWRNKICSNKANNVTKWFSDISSDLTCSFEWGEEHEGYTRAQSDEIANTHHGGTNVLSAWPSKNAPTNSLQEQMYNMW